MVGVLDTLKGKASLAGQWAKGFLADAVDTASRPSIKKLVEIAENEWRTGFAARSVPIIEEALKEGIRLHPVVQNAHRQLILEAANYDPLSQNGTYALAQLAQRGDEGRRAFFDFCARHNSYAAGARIIELMITHGGKEQREFFRSPAFYEFAQDVFHGAERNKGTVADTVDLSRRRERVFGYLDAIKEAGGPAIESP